MKKLSIFISLFLLPATFDASFILNSLQEARAIKAYKNAQYDKALKIYNKLATDKPYDSVYNYNIGDILYKSGKFQESFSYYKRAIEYGSMPIKVQSLFNIGNVHMQEKAYDDAINSYEEVLKLHPENQPAKHNLEVAKKLKEQKNQEDQKQDSQDQNNDQDEKQGSDSQQKDQKQDSKSDKNSKDTKKDSGDQKQSGSEKNQKNDGSSEEKENRADQKQGQKDQQKQSQDQQKDASKDQAEKSDEEIEKDLAQAQKEQRKQQEKEEKEQRAPQSGNASEEKDFSQQLDDSLYQEMQKSAADDDRLSAKEAQLMQQMEDLEKNVTKNVMKHMIRTQTAGFNDGNKW